MAVYKLFPTKDASLYSEFPDTNTGLDQILESSTYFKLGTPYVSRYLIEFSTTEITDILDNRVGNSSFATYLRNYSALVTSLNTDSKLEVKTISGSWDMGTGKLGYSPAVENGCSWFWRSYLGIVVQFQMMGF